MTLIIVHHRTVSYTILVLFILVTCFICLPHDWSLCSYWHDPWMLGCIWMHVILLKMDVLWQEFINQACVTIAYYLKKDNSCWLISKYPKIYYTLLALVSLTLHIYMPKKYHALFMILIVNSSTYEILIHNSPKLDIACLLYTSDAADE